jgi:hypothetical protein
MDEARLYELVHEAVTEALEAREGGREVELLRRFQNGRLLFEDDQGREAKAIPIDSLFKKVTAIRDKLRVLEQKVNAHDRLDATDKAEMQAYITRCYGSLTTFNFLFADDGDKFTGTGS